MKNSARWLTALALGAALLIAAPLVYAGSGGNDRGFGGKHRSECDDGRSDRGGKRGGRDLDVVGLTATEADLLRGGRPNNAEKIGTVSG